MTESILNTIKKMLGISPDDTSFDVDIMVHINTAFMFLNQLGIGTEGVYAIENHQEVWADFLIDPDAYPATKAFVYICVRLAFDPPSTSFGITAFENQKQELGWRLAAQVPIPPET
jgi:hypothetical protein